MWLIKPDEGSLLVDNVTKEKQDIHNYFSYVPQDPFLLNENIIKNISFSVDENKVDIKRIKSVLKKVGFLDILGDKINEPLGENGIKISGGQKQRIAIARALYFNKK